MEESFPEWAFAPKSIQCRECMELQDCIAEGTIGDYVITRRESHKKECSRYEHNGELI